VTRGSSAQKADFKLEYLESGLGDLVNVVRDRQIRSIAVPPLGVGLGGLAWRDVRPLIERALSDVANLEVLVFELNHHLIAHK
jgi:O-acetyl-ADP-ribose deacetylase (regulator of RNase III)